MNARYDFTNTLTVDKSFYVSRKGVSADLDDHLADSGSACVYGVARVGKSAVARHCALNFSRLPGAMVGEVRFKGSDCFEVCGKDSLVNQFKGKIGDVLLADAKRRLVVVDEIDYGLKTWNDHSQLVDFFNFCNGLMGEGVQFVMAGQMLPEDWLEAWPEITAAFPARESFWDVEIRPFTEEELAEYCSHSKAHVGTAMVRWIHEKTGGLAGAVNVALQRHNQLFRRTGKTPAIADLASDSFVLTNLAKFCVGVRMKQEVFKTKRPGAGGRSHYPTLRVSDNVFISKDRKILKVGRDQYRLTRQSVWDIVDKLLTAAAGAAETAYIPFNGQMKDKFRKGDSHRFLKECVDIPKDHGIITRAAFKRKLLSLHRGEL